MRSHNRSPSVVGRVAHGARTTPSPRERLTLVSETNEPGRHSCARPQVRQQASGKPTTLSRQGRPTVYVGKSLVQRDTRGGDSDFGRCARSLCAGSSGQTTKPSVPSASATESPHAWGDLRRRRSFTAGAPREPSGVPTQAPPRLRPARALVLRTRPGCNVRSTAPTISTPPRNVFGAAARRVSTARLRSGEPAKPASTDIRSRNPLKRAGPVPTSCPPFVHRAV